MHTMEQSEVAQELAMRPGMSVCDYDKVGSGCRQKGYDDMAVLHQAGRGGWV